MAARKEGTGSPPLTPTLTPKYQHIRGNDTGKGQKSPVVLPSEVTAARVMHSGYACLELRDICRV